MMLLSIKYISPYVSFRNIIHRYDNIWAQGALGEIKFLDDFKRFWREQSRNYKVYLVRDILSTLLGRIGDQYGTYYMSLLGASDYYIAVLNSINAAVRFIFALPGGLLVDRSKNVKRIYIIGRFLQLPVNLIKAYASNFYMYMGSRVWNVATFRLTMPSANIISIAALKNKNRVKGMVTSRTITSAVGLVAPMLTAWIISSLGGLNDVDNYRPLFLIQFAVSVVIFIILATQLENPEYTRKVRKKEAGVFRESLGLFSEVKGLKWVLALDVARTLFMNMRMPFMMLYIINVKMANEWVIGYRGTVTTAVALLFTIPIGNLADRFGRRKIGYLAQAFNGASILVTVLTPPTQPEWLVLASFLSSLGMSMDIGWRAYIQEYIPLDVRGRWSGISTTITALIGIPAPLIGGVIWEYNPDYLWWMMLLYYFAIAIPLRYILPHKESTDPEILGDSGNTQT